MALKRRHFTREFKLQVVRDVQAGKPVAQAGFEHQIHPNLIAKWRQAHPRYAECAFAGNGHRYRDEARIAELQRLIGELTEGLSSLDMRTDHPRAKAAQDRGVQIVLGRFRPVDKKCFARCREKFTTYEEKRTDVNIAVTMLKLASQDRYDKGILISTDSDLIPTLEAVHSTRPDVKTMVVVPINKKAQALLGVADYRRDMKRSDLQQSLLPQTVQTSTGKTINSPPGWT